MSKVFQDLIQTTGYRYANDFGVLIGQSEGYTLFIEDLGQTASEANISQITFSAKKKDVENSQDLFSTLLDEKEIRALTISGSRLVFRTKGAMTKGKAKEHLHHALDTIVAFLKSNGFENVCENQLTVGETNVYVIGGACHILSSEGFDVLNKEQEKENEEYNSRTENIPSGILGAFLGSLIGVAAILLIAQLGYVSFWSGLIMGFCTVMGYEMFARKLSTKGIALSLIIVVGMTYFANQLDWAVTIIRDLGGNYTTDLFDVLAALPSLLSEGALDSGVYWYNLGLLFLFSGTGAILSIFSRLKAYKDSFKSHQL